MSAPVTVAELVARLRAETGDFTRGMTQAQSAAKGFEGALGKVGNTARAMGSAIDQTANAAGLAMAGLATYVAHVGIQYNTLEQTSKAAFKTILGSGDAATKMMVDLREFAKASPFPRQAFIEATQQLLGFGLEARKVIPTLQAIQDAVAATGGGAQQIATISTALAQVVGQGKFTGQVFQTLGQQGIDAAKIIGQQLHKTAADVRNTVTNGKADVTTYLDALTAGMEKTFGGAAAGVKATWTGATDRVKGAMRDISSALVEPFISKGGGGMAVDWANSLADALRRIEKDVIPGLIGPITTFGEKIGSIFRTVMDFSKGLSTGGLADMVGPIKDLIPLFGLLAASSAKAGFSMLPIIGNFANFLPLPGKVASAIIGLVLSTDKGRESLLRIGETIKDAVVQVAPAAIAFMDELAKAIGDVAPSVADFVQSFADAAIPTFITAIQMATSVLGPLASVLSATVDFLTPMAPLLVVIAEGWAAWKVIDTITGPLKSVMASLNGLATTVGPGAAASMKELTSSMMGFVNAGLAGAAIGIGIGLNILQRAAQGAAADLKPVNDHLNDSKANMLGMRDAFNEAQAAYDHFAHDRTQNPLPHFDVGDAKGMNAAYDTAAKSMDGLNSAMAAGRGLLEDIQNSSGMTADEIGHMGTTIMDSTGKLVAFDSGTVYAMDAIDSLAQKYGVDLTQGVEKAGPALHEAWKQAVKAGDADTYLAKSVGLTVQAYHKQHDVAVWVRAVTAQASVGAKDYASALSFVGDAGWDAADAVQATVDAIDKQVKAFTDPVTIYKKAVSDVDAFTKASAQNSVDSAAKAADAQIAGIEKSVNANDTLKKSIEDSGSTVSEYAQQAVTGGKSVQEYAQQVALGGKSVDDYAASQNTANAKLQAFIDMTAKRAQSLKDWKDNLLKLGSAFPVLAQEMAKMGPESADLVASLTGATDETKQSLQDMMTGNASFSAQGVVSELSTIQSVVAKAGFKNADELAASLGLTPQQFQDLADNVGTDLGKIVDIMAADIAGHAGKVGDSGGEITKALAAGLGKSIPEVEGVLSSYGPLIAGYLNPTIVAAGGIPLPTAIDTGFHFKGVNTGGGHVASAQGNFFEDHSAQIAMGGAMRVWAEPETGGEAYIPLAQSKRTRSVGILQKVAAKFKMGLHQYADGGFGVPMPLDTRDPSKYGYFGAPTYDVNSYTYRAVVARLQAGQAASSANGNYFDSVGGGGGGVSGGSSGFSGPAGGGSLNLPPVHQTFVMPPNADIAEQAARGTKRALILSRRG